MLPLPFRAILRASLASLAALWLATGLSGAAQAQGLDCSTPQAIAGLGTFAYDNTTGGSSSFGAGTPCQLLGGGNGTERYFQWTANAAGDYLLRLKVATFDRDLSVFTGSGCAAVCLTDGSPQSAPDGLYVHATIQGVQSGDTYLVRIANHNHPGGPGVLEIGWDPCFPPQVVDDGFEENDTCASGVPLPQGTYTSLFVSPADEDHYRITIPPLHRAALDYGSFQDPVIYQSFDDLCQPVGSGQFAWSRVNLTHAPIEERVQVRPFSGQACAVYDLALTFVPLDCGPNPGMDDPWEDNDTCSQAAAIGPGMHTGLWTSSADRDFFAVTLQPGERLMAQAFRGSEELLFERFGDACELVQTTTAALSITNFESTPQNVRFAPQPPFPGSEPWCAGYDLDVQIAPNPCADLGPGVLPAHPSYRDVSNGTYPGLYLEPATFLQFCVPPGATWSADLALRRPDGALEAHLICLTPIGDCFFLPTYASGSGQSFTLSWTNSFSHWRFLQLSLVYSGGSAECNHVDLTVQGSGGCEGILPTQEFCQPATPNSTGQPSVLFATQPYGTTPEVQMEAVQGPPGQFGFLLAGTAALEPGTPISQGSLCLNLGGGNQVGRYNIAGSPRNSLGRFDSYGRWENLAGTSDSPFGYSLPGVTPWGAAFAPGQSVHFQLWHRENGGASNFSNGVSVQF